MKIKAKELKPGIQFWAENKGVFISLDKEEFVSKDGTIPSISIDNPCAVYWFKADQEVFI